MATRKKTAHTTAVEVLEGIDLAAFAAQKQLIEQKANEALAERVERIRTAIAEMKTISEATGVSVSLSTLVGELSDARDELDADWNSSSYHC